VVPHAGSAQRLGQAHLDSEQGGAHLAGPAIDEGQAVGRRSGAAPWRDVHPAWPLGPRGLRPPDMGRHLSDSPTVPNAIPQNAPRNVIVVLLDSLNRHMLGAYGGTEFETPTLDRFAAGSVRFTRHYTGSLPCMPARHDILCGALDFLWKA